MKIHIIGGTGKGFCVFKRMKRNAVADGRNGKGFQSKVRSLMASDMSSLFTPMYSIVTLMTRGCSASVSRKKGCS